MVVFQCSQVTWQCQIPIRFPAFGMELILRWEADKSVYPNKLDVRMPLVLKTFTEKWNAESLHRGLKLANFKPRLESVIFKWIFWPNALLLGSDGQGWQKEGVNTQLIAPISATFFSVFTFIFFFFFITLRVLRLRAWHLSLVYLPILHMFGISGSKVRFSILASIKSRICSFLCYIVVHVRFN